jgi:hypothetical protein
MLANPGQIAALAQQYGLDPAYADAVASRESSFNPNAHASKSIYGLFQMSGPLRAKYGVPLGADVATQVRGFAAFTNDLKQEMTTALGREPTNSELYLGHYWGPQRAAGVISGHYADMPARDVFTPQELAANPNLDPDKPVGEIAQGITADIGKRSARYGGQGGTEVADLTGYGTADEAPPAAAADVKQETTAPTKAPTSTNSADLTSYGSPAPTDPETAAAISSMAQKDTGKELSDALSSIGSASNGTTAPAPPSLPTPNPDAAYLESAMLQRQMGPVSGIAAMPGQKAQASPMLPGGGGAAPGFNPAMFGTPPTQQQV